MKHTQLLITVVPNSPDLVNLAELRVVKLFYIDASHTIYYILNCGVTQLNLTKILHDVQTLVALLTHDIQDNIAFRFGTPEQ